MLNLGAALPEIFMAVSALALLMLGVFAGKDKASAPYPGWQLPPRSLPSFWW